MAGQINDFRKDLSAVSEHNEHSISNANIYRAGINRPNGVIGGGPAAANISGYIHDSLNQANSSKDISGISTSNKNIAGIARDN